MFDFSPRHSDASFARPAAGVVQTLGVILIGTSQGAVVDIRQPDALGWTTWSSS